MVESACRYIDENYEDDVRLEALADALGVSSQTLQRTFREVIGITPRVYARERRLDQFRDELRSGSDVSRAIYGAGFSSPSRVYERAGDDLGMTPAQYRARCARRRRIRVALGQSPFGMVGVGRTDAGICSIRLGDAPDDVLSAITTEFPRAEIALVEADPDLDLIVAHIVAGTSIVDLPLDLRGTAFQRKVWTELRRIPRGEQRTYQQIAEQVGSPALGPRRGQCLWRKPDRAGRALPSGRAIRRRARRLPLGRRAQAGNSRRSNRPDDSLISHQDAVQGYYAVSILGRRGATSHAPCVCERAWEGACTAKP